MPVDRVFGRGALLGPSLGMVCLLVVALCGCAGSTPTPVAVTIAFAFPRVDEEYYEPLGRQFNENYPHITVELHPKTWDELDLIGAVESDVFAVGALRLSEMHEEGDLLSLDPFIEQDKSLNVDDFYPGTLDLLSSEGATWAIPIGLDVNVMYYSQDLFDQHNLAYPASGWTWENFLESAIAVNDPDAGIFGYATTPGHVDAALFIYQHGGRIIDDPENPRRTTFDDSLTIDAMEWYASLFDEYDVAPTPKEARAAFGGRQYAVYQGLRNGMVGMWVGDLSERGGLSWPVEWYVNWGMAPLPSDAQSATLVSTHGSAISSQAAQPDACWRWIMFLSQQLTYRFMPARRSVAESEAYEQQVGEEVAATARASMDNAMLVSPRIWVEFGAAMDLFEEAVGKIISESEEISPGEAMAWAQQEAERIGLESGELDAE